MTSFNLPARQALIPELVGPDRLMNAFALQALMGNMMRLAGPTIAGVAIAWTAPGPGAVEGATASACRT